AFLIASKIESTFQLNVKCNNLDIRGTIEEFKVSKIRKFFYLYVKHQLRRALKIASSVTTVTSSLKTHLLESCNIGNLSVKIRVNPTLSILNYSFSTRKRNIAYIGNVGWIEPNLFVEQLLKVNRL